MATLVDHAKSLANKAATPCSPPEAHNHFNREEMIKIFGAYHLEFTRSEKALSIWQQLVTQLGLTTDLLARDRLFARVQTPDGEKDHVDRNRVISALRLHRDTWGSNLYAQVNWWAPVFPISAGRTMAIFPDLWDRPIPNSSLDFDLSAVIRQSRDKTSAPPDVDTVIPHMSADL